MFPAEGGERKREEEKTAESEEEEGKAREPRPEEERKKKEGKERVKIEEALDKTRWQILAAVAEEPRSPAEIARATGASLANISQQARLLEAYGLIKAAKEKRGVPGKPRLIYTLARETGYLVLLKQGFAAKKSLALDHFREAMLSICFWERSEDHYFLGKFLWQEEEYVNECDAIAISEAKGAEIHLLVIAAPEKLDLLRKKFSKAEVTGQRGKRNIVSWTHSVAEIKEGIARREAYFLNLLKKTHVIFDRKGSFAEVRRAEE